MKHKFEIVKIVKLTKHVIVDDNPDIIAEDAAIAEATSEFNEDEWEEISTDYEAYLDK